METNLLIDPAATEMTEAQELDTQQADEFLFEVAKDPQSEHDAQLAVGTGKCYCHCHCERPN